MNYLSKWRWDDVVFNAASCLAAQFYQIGIDVFEDDAPGDRRTLSRDYNCFDLPDLVDEGMFKVSMRDIEEGFETVFVFQGTDDDEYVKVFLKWPSEMPLGRFVSVNLDCSHGRGSYYAAMFRGDKASLDQVMVFKLKYC